MLFITFRGLEGRDKHLSHRRCDGLEFLGIITIEFDEGHREIKTFFKRRFLLKSLNEMIAFLQFVSMGLDLPSHEPRDEAGQEYDDDNGDDFFNDEILRIVVEMFPDPDPGYDQTNQKERRGQVGLSLLAVSHFIHYDSSLTELFFYPFGCSEGGDMRLTILGSGTNLHPTRAAAGYLVETDQPFMLDFGPRTLINLLKTNTDRHQIRHVLFSHYHADHFSDFVTFFFDAVCHSKFVSKRENLTIWGPRGTKHLFGTILRTFPSFREAPFRVTLKEVQDRGFRLGKTRIIPTTVTHSDQIHSVGYRIEYQGRILTYSGDARYAQNLVRLCQQAHVAILDCSFPANRPGVGHMHAGECGRIAQEAQVKNLILSHLYPIADRYDVKKQAARFFRGKIRVGRDLMRIAV